MPSQLVRLSALVFVLMIASNLSAAPAKGVTVVPNETSKRVDVLIDGKPFTSYIWPDTLKKPVLFPLHSASGTIVTRGYPLDPRPEGGRFACFVDVTTTKPHAAHAEETAHA